MKFSDLPPKNTGNGEDDPSGEGKNDPGSDSPNSPPEPGLPPSTALRRKLERDLEDIRRRVRSGDGASGYRPKRLFSDIKGQEDAETPVVPNEPPPPVAPPSPPPARATPARPPETPAPAPAQPKREEPAPRSPVKVPLPPPEPVAGRWEPARKLYGGALEITQRIFDATATEVPDASEILPLVRALAAEIQTPGERLSCLSGLTHRQDYLLSHSVNTTILALKVAFDQNVDADEIEALGVAALLHDIGLAPHREIVLAARELSDAEDKKVAAHVADGLEALSRMDALPEALRSRAAEWIGQTHERVDGSGYPRGLRDEAIHPHAALIGLCDTYESMSHPRPWNPAPFPHGAIRNLMGPEKGGFDRDAMRGLIDALGIFPPGSLVRLSTGEIARIIRASKGWSVRPRLELLVGADRRPVPTRHVFDLARQPLIHIAGAADAAKLTIKHPSLENVFDETIWWPAEEGA